MKNNTIFKKAYIQRINGEYVNDASFYYTNGLRLLGIPVEFFDEDKPYNLKLGRDIIVVAGVPTTLKVLSQMGIEPPSPLDIPEGLYEYCGRNILRGRLQEFLNSPLAKYPMFVKPAQHGKLFNGQIVSCKEELEMFKYCHELGVKIPIISSEPVNFISEYRCFVMKDKTGVFSILDCRRYRGDYQKIPDFSIIENAIKDYKNSPVAYAIDFGVTDDGSQQVTFGLRPIIGIKYHNGQDNCILHFDNTKVVLWLYKNGYDITELLEMNSHFSEMESDFENFSFAIHWLIEKRKHIEEDKKHLYTLDYVIEELKKYNEKYYYKDYE